MTLQEKILLSFKKITLAPTFLSFHDTDEFEESVWIPFSEFYSFFEIRAYDYFSLAFPTLASAFDTILDLQDIDEEQFIFQAGRILKSIILKFVIASRNFQNFFFFKSFNSNVSLSININMEKFPFGEKYKPSSYFYSSVDQFVCLLLYAPAITVVFYFIKAFGIFPKLFIFELFICLFFFVPVHVAISMRKVFFDYVVNTKVAGLLFFYSFFSFYFAWSFFSFKFLYTLL